MFNQSLARSHSNSRHSNQSPTTSSPVAQRIAEQRLDAERPKSFQQHPLSPIAYFTRDQLKEILPSYLPEPEHQDAVIGEWKAFMDDKNTSYQTVPNLIQKPLGEAAAEASIEYVKTENAKKSPDGNAISTLHRGDTREFAEIVKAQGFHGWGGSMSVEHARSWVTNVWEPMSNQQKGAWLQTWKSQTSDSNATLPFVATGWESQKAGVEYKIGVPFEIPNPKVTPQVAFNGDTLENSSIICITGRNEVVFLTGIPMKYISQQGQAPRPAGSK